MATATGAQKLLTLTASAASATGDDWELPCGAIGAIFVMDITAVSGVTSGCVLAIQGKDETSGKYYQLTTNIAAVTLTGTKVHVIFPGAGTTPGAGSGITTVTETTFIPPKGRVTWTRTDGTFTGTVSMTPLING